MILDLTYSEVVEYVKALGEPAYRAKQLFEACTLGKPLEEVSNLPKAFKEKIEKDYPKFEVVAHLVSKDETQKVALKFPDGSIVESVLLKYKYGYTVCVSSKWITPFSTPERFASNVTQVSFLQCASSVFPTSASPA